tara:strand:- start:13426 stop:13977 length:552 start_codon:yes stop_codon:yes gene_type:complete
MKYENVMIDLETLGITPQAPIASIGAVCFSPDLNDLSKEPFYAELDWKRQDRKVCESTIEWWDTQPAEAFAALGGQDNIVQVLIDLAEWLPANAKVWGNGATFDISMLEDAYRQYGLPIPWKFWNVRDCRTVVDMYKSYRLFNKDAVELNRPANNHNALADAVNQAEHISSLWQAMIHNNKNK